MLLRGSGAGADALVVGELLPVRVRETGVWSRWRWGFGVPTRSPNEGGDRHAKWPWYMETIPALSGRKSGTIKPWAKGASDDVVGLR